MADINVRFQDLAPDRATHPEPFSMVYRPPEEVATKVSDCGNESIRNIFERDLDPRSPGYLNFTQVRSQADIFLYASCLSLQPSSFVANRPLGTLRTSLFSLRWVMSSHRALQPFDRRTLLFLCLLYVFSCFFECWKAFQSK